MAFKEQERLLGQKLKIARMEAGLSQAALGKACGVSAQQIQKLERGENRISATMLRRLSYQLKKPFTWFFEEAEEVQILGGADTRFVLSLCRQFGGIQNPRVQSYLAEVLRLAVKRFG